MDKVNTSNRPVIFYGAGHEAQFVVEKFVAKGVVPACFCDRDPQKWGRAFLGVECMPLEAAIKKYPNFLMVVTPQIPLRFRIMEDLLNQKIVTREQLLNYEPYIKMKSCTSLHSILDASAFKVLAICCGQIESNHRPQIPFSGDLMESVLNVKQFRQSILRDLNSPTPISHSACNDCRWAVEDYWPVDTRIRTVKYDFGGVMSLSWYARKLTKGAAGFKKSKKN